MQGKEKRPRFDPFRTLRWRFVFGFHVVLTIFIIVLFVGFAASRPDDTGTRTQDTLIVAALALAPLVLHAIILFSTRAERDQ